MDLRRSMLVLAGLSGAALGVFVLGPTAVAAAPLDAKKMVISNCQQCHEVKGIGDYGNVAPSLVDLKARYPDRKEIAAIISDETKRNPQTVMPPFGRNLILTSEEIDTIVDFLYKQ
jgi:sulfur-oxidizing protein SoxX